MPRYHCVLVAMEADVWIVESCHSQTVLRGCVAALSNSEVERALRFATAQLRSRFAFNRGVLRLILSRYTGSTPALLRFASGPHGKPFLPCSTVNFNVTHSGDYLACAVTRDVTVGIDIEKIRDIPELFAIARGHFSPRECEQLEALPAFYLTRGFFECWTRKEAFVKATGLGLSQRLDHFEVTFGPDSAPRLVQICGGSGFSEGWGIHALDLAASYCGAFAAEARNISYIYYRLGQLDIDRIVSSPVSVPPLDTRQAALLESLV
jgi:4'-phosphopantetheinyl transferase